MTYNNPGDKPGYDMVGDVPGWEQFDFDDVTRVEVITYPGGRQEPIYGASKVSVSIQDDGRTLKLFLNKYDT